MQNIISSFIGETTTEMLRSGVSVRLSSKPFVTDPDDGLECSGWFCPVTLELTVATGVPSWLEIYAHEYCHFTQWKDGFLKADTDDEQVFDWLSGANFTYDIVEKSVRSAQMIEADNERRTVEIIKKFNLPINVSEYIQKSNAYLLFYNVVLETRRWAKGSEPSYSIPEIYKRLPDDHVLSGEDIFVTPPWFKEELLKRLAPQCSLKAEQLANLDFYNPAPQ